MRLKSLRLQNFRSFSDSTITFPESGLVLIRGTDVETGESSGTGKTAVFLGIAYAFDILPPQFSAKSLQNWDTEEALQVTLTLEIEDKTVTLYRGKKCLVDFGDRQVTGAKSYTEAVAQLIGFSPEVLSALTYRHQSQGGFFLGMTPADKIEFLTRILGLDAVEKAVQVAQDKAKLLEAAVDQKNAQVKQAEGWLQTAISEVIPDEIDTSNIRQDLAKANGLYEANQSALKDLEAKLAESQTTTRASRAQEIQAKKTDADKARAFLNKLKETDDAAFREIETRKREINQTIQRLVLSIQRLDIQTQEIAGLERELAALSVGNCPTCSREWDKAAVKRETIQAKIQNLQVEAQGRAVFQNQKNELEKNLRDIAAHVSDPRIEQVRKVEQRLREELAVLENIKNTDEIQRIESEILSKNRIALSLRDAVRKLQGDLRVAETQVGARQGLIDRRNRAIEKAEAEVRSLTAAKTTSEVALAAEKDFVALMGREGFLGLIFEEVLQEIATEANVRLGRLANVNRVGLAFTTETEKGRRQIQTWVDVRGHRSKFETGLSGGMQTSLEQVTDLAVMAVIASRTGGKVPGWLCLDEVFDGQGRVTKESALEVLQEFAQNRLVLVIDHGSEFKEAFTKTIDIQFEAGKSQVS